MIISIGIDIIEVARIREVLVRTPRFAERVFTAAERQYCDSRGVGVRTALCRALRGKRSGAESIANWLAWRNQLAGRGSGVKREWCALPDLYGTGAGGL